MERASNIAEQIEKINSADKAAQLEALVSIRQILSVEQNPPIDEVIASGVVPKLFEFMKPDNEENFQLESCWAVTNICSGTSKHVQYVVNLGGLDYLIDLLNSSSPDVADQAIWALGNIAGDNKEHKKLCLTKDITNKIVSIFNKFPDNKALRRNCIWALSNCLRDRPECPWDLISNGVAIMKNVLATKNEKEDITADALWSLVKCSEAYTQEIIDFGFVPDLIYHFQNSNKPDVIVPAMTILGNIISGSVSQASTILDNKEFLPRVVQMLSNFKREIRKTACKIISDVITRSQQGLLFILKDSDCMSALIKIAKTDAGDVREEAIRALANIALTASKEQVTQLQDQFNYLQCLLDLLGDSNVKVLEGTLEAVSCVWKPGNEKCDSPLVEFGNEHINRLESLSTFKNEGIARLAKSVLGSLGTKTDENKEEKTTK